MRNFDETHEMMQGQNIFTIFFVDYKGRRSLSVEMNDLYVVYGMQSAVFTRLSQVLEVSHKFPNSGFWPGVSVCLIVFFICLSLDSWQISISAFPQIFISIWRQMNKGSTNEHYRDKIPQAHVGHSPARTCKKPRTCWRSAECTTRSASEAEYVSAVHECPSALSFYIWKWACHTFAHSIVVIKTYY